MNDRSTQAHISVSIAAVERDTGLSKDTLRVWERRYGFPQPGRDGFGERIYPLEQVDKLRIIKRLIDQGHRPGKIIGLTVDELQSLAQAAVATPTRGDAAVESEEDLQRYLELVKAHRIDELRRQLSQTLLRLGLARFIGAVVAPLNDMVGDAWTRGYFEIFEEHLYTESIQVILRDAINGIPASDGPPRVMLTTFPQEAHGLGVLMAEAIFSLEGCRCISLGVQTPLWDILQAATVQHVDVVALSFSAAINANQAIDGLVELRAKLPGTMEIWAGGSCPGLHRRPPQGIVMVNSLGAIEAELARWRGSRWPKSG